MIIEHFKKHCVIHIEINEDFKKIVKPSKLKRVHVAVFCEFCDRNHHLHFGEFNNGRKNSKNIKEVLFKYKSKYCIPYSYK